MHRGVFVESRYCDHVVAKIQKKKNTHKERWKIIKCCCMVGRSRTGFICHCRIFIARNKKFNRSNHSDSTDLFVRTFGHLAKSPFRRFLIKYQSCIDKLSSSRRSFLKNRIWIHQRQELQLALLLIKKTFIIIIDTMRMRFWQIAISYENNVNIEEKRRILKTDRRLFCDTHTKITENST